ncbi:esterase/lipase family protein [Candidatus Magnetaquicoccus inordinatus]|uniref:esterase/lipase family protein n=1 Tax=Candidatus Magnetaquicoccus inordinatus TaxID=2496818 RepID=UPI00102C1498|nr:alpha/beta fold hydrolase [Candidatus Magnetaquicoccus inordinatus]
MENAEDKQIAVLIHGLWLNGSEMQLLAVRLRQLGYQTLFFRYRSVHAQVSQSSHELWLYLQHHFGPGMKQAPEKGVHLVCHSLGGMVALDMLHRHPEARIGRMVALGTPFRGNMAAKKMAQWSWGRMALGKSMHRALGGGGFTHVPEGREIGILAGDRSPWGAGRTLWGIGEANDGNVAVSETLLDGAKEHRTLPVIHMGLLISPQAIQMVHQFLQTGRFE